jgi:RNA polymerase primary sigma factor
MARQQSSYSEGVAAVNGTGAERSTLARYFSDIRKIPILTQEQEAELGRRIQAGDEEALERLVEANLKFVVSIANEYRNLGLPYEDAINEGNLGLIEAARRFDPERGAKFISWAVWWIRRAIRSALSDQSYAVRLPVSQFRRMQEVKETERHLAKELGRAPTHEELSAKLPRKLAQVDPIHRHGIRISSLDYTPPEEQNGTFVDSLQDDNLVPIERQLLDDERVSCINALYEKLPDQQRTVIACRFGIDGERPQTLSEIGRRIGRSREGVRLIECKAIERLRRLFAARDIGSRLPRAHDDFDHAA